MNTVFHVKDDSPDIYLGLRIRHHHDNQTLILDQ
jgi:hypothetical protein